LAILKEQERFISGLNPPQPVFFRSNHASNALALAWNLPRDNCCNCVRRWLDIGHCGRISCAGFDKTMRSKIFSIKGKPGETGLSFAGT
jgi:hypothetical protein